LFFFLLFFPRLISAAADWMSAILPHMVWPLCEFKMHVWNLLHAARWKHNWVIKTSNFLQILKKKQTTCILVASTFVIRPQILIFSVFKIANLSLYWLQIKFSMSLFFYLFTFAINLWHRKFVTADVTAVFVNNQYDIKLRGQDFDKKFVFEGVHRYSKEADRRIFREKLDKAWR